MGYARLSPLDDYPTEFGYDPDYPETLVRFTPDLPIEEDVNDPSYVFNHLCEENARILRYFGFRPEWMVALFKWWRVT